MSTGLCQQSQIGRRPGGSSYSDEHSCPGLVALLRTFEEQLSSQHAILPIRSQRALRHFERQPAKIRADILRRFEDYVEITSAAIADGHSLKDTGKLLWYAFRQWGVRPPSDLLDIIAPDDVVEVYNPEFIQIFRNLRFFEISGYTVADILVHEWRELYDREDEFTRAIAAQGIACFQGQYPGTTRWQVRPHELTEKFSDPRHVMRMQLRHLAPLFDRSGSVAAVLATSSVEILESPPAPLTRDAQTAALRPVPTPP